MPMHILRLVLLSIESAVPLLIWILLQRPHKLICNGNCDIKVAYLAFFLFAPYKIHYIRMINPHHGHIGSMTRITCVQTSINHMNILYFKVIDLLSSNALYLLNFCWQKFQPKTALFQVINRKQGFGFIKLSNTRIAYSLPHAIMFSLDVFP